MLNNRTLGLLLILFWLMLSATAAHGQIIHGQPGSGGTGVTYTHWKLDTDSDGSTEITQLWAPFSGMVPLGDNTEAAFFISGVQSKFEYAGTKADLDGLSDARLQFSRSMANDRFLVSFGVNLPTGKKELEANVERQIIETLAASFLDFPLRRYGEGFGLNLLAGTALELGEINAGVGVQYEYIGTYKPYVDIEDYDPGDLFNVYAGGDLSRGDLSWSGNILFTTFVADRIAGAKVLKQSSQLELQLAGLFDNQRHRVSGQISYTFRGRNSRYDSGTEEVIERLKLYGNELYLSGRYTSILESGWSIGPSVSLKLVEGDEARFGKSTILSVSGLVGKQVSRRVTANAGLRYMTGTADDSRLDVSGLQITTGLNATF